MKIIVIAVGRLKSGPERELVQRYAERFEATARTLGLSGPQIIELAESPARSVSERKAQEAQAILSHVAEGVSVVALDERGQTPGSAVFAQDIARMRDNGGKSLAFIIGGADGLGDAVTARAAKVISFGAMTMPHQLVRVLLLEQLYRAATILSGHPYHRI